MKPQKINWRYTIGEILIVSVGILIAFGINTCSANMSKKREMAEYKKSLKTDINENLKSLSRIIDKQSEKVEQLNRLVALLEQNHFDIDTVGHIFYEQRKSPTFFPVSGTFKSLVAQGEIEIFSTELKRELFNLYDTNYERTEYNGVLYDKIYVDVYDKELREIMNLRTQEIENVERLKSKAFIKNILLIIDEAESYLGLIKVSESESQKLLNKIG